MSSKLPTFAGGATGAAVVYAGLIARNWDALSALTAGNPKGLVVVVAVAVLVAVLSGVVALMIAPKGFGGAMGAGLVLPMLLLVGGIPRMGIPDSPPAEGEKPSPMPALWFPLNPVASVAAGTAAKANAEAGEAAKQVIEHAKKKLDQEQETLIQQAESRVQQSANETRKQALAEQKRTLEARHEQTINAAKSKWERERASVVADRDQMSRRANEAEAAIKTLEEKIYQFESEMRDLRDARERRAELQAAFDRLSKEAAESKAAAAKAEAEAADFERIFGWYLREGSGSARPIAILGKKLASRDVEDRVTAARLLVHCGPEAKKWLQRALNDTEEAVRDAAQRSLDRIG